MTMTNFAFVNRTFEESFRELEKYTFTKSFQDYAFSNTQSTIIKKHPVIAAATAATTTTTTTTSIHESEITMNPYTKKQAVKPPPPPPAAASPPQPKSLYDPAAAVCSDTLFWSIYIGVYGISEYQRITTNYGLCELNEKKKIAEFLNKSENKLKMKATSYKVTKGGIQEIQSDCHTQTSTTSFPVVIAMSVFYEKNIWIVDQKRNVFLKFNGKPDSADADASETPSKNPCMILYKNSPTNPKHKIRYSVETCPTVDLVMNISEKMICLDHYESPIKAASNYKMEDLEFMAEILQVNLNEHAAASSGKKLKKMDLYNLVKQMCVWS
jgi:hypothetical protein